jgi:hypothetical protein
MTRIGLILAFGILVIATVGCRAYEGVHRPRASVGILPKQASEAELESWLTTTVRPKVPSTLAIVRMRTTSPYGYEYGDPPVQIDSIQQDESGAWRGLAGLTDEKGRKLIEDVTFVSPLLSQEEPTLDTLRQAAARLRAPLLLVYMFQDDAEDGYNDSSLLYWTIVGMWTVPGNVVGYYSAGQGLLIDTVSGQIVAVANAESKQEEAVTAAAFDIAKNRIARNARSETLAGLVQDVRAKLLQATQSP